MTKNGKVLNSRDARLEYITIELFNSIRGCYNKGNNELQATIQRSVYGYYIGIIRKWIR